MIERLILRNFQKHHKLVIDFQQITCLIGSSDIGKSSIIRALYWITHNSPSGNAFISWGSDFCKASLIVDGIRLTRKKGKENNYILGEKEFHAIKTSVPEEVANFLNLSEVNFQLQHDAPFWLSDSAGEVSRRLNAIINLEVMDTSLSWISSSLRKARDHQTVIEERLESIQEKLTSLQWVDECNRELKKIELLQKQDLELLEKQGHLIALLEKIQSLQKKANVPIPDLVELEKIKAKYDKLDSQCQDLGMLIIQINSIEKNLVSISNSLEQAEIEFHKISKGRCPLCQR